MKFYLSKEGRELLKNARTIDICKNEDCSEKETYYYFPFCIKESDDDWYSMVNFKDLPIPDDIKEKILNKWK